MKTFDELWKDIEERSKRWCIPIVQEYKELEYVFKLIKGCKSYLEIGTAEGNGLYVLSHALSDDAFIEYVDFGEKHTKAARDEVCAKIKQRAVDNHGNSHYAFIINQMCSREIDRDVVFIDAGHTYEDVIADAIAYGHLATKYIIFHDICLPPVKAAVEWYLQQNPQFKYHEFINSPSYGYGIIEVQ